MGRPPTEDNKIKQIEDIWATNPKQSGAKVCASYRRKYGDDLSKSKIEKVVSGLKKKDRESNSPRLNKQFWIPWTTDETPEDTSFLFEIQAYCLTYLGRRIFEHEAAWAKRLRVALTGASVSLAWFIISTYAFNEEIAATLGSERARTEDLDAYVMFKAWIPERQPDYISAIKARLIPLPSFAGWPAELSELPIELQQLAKELGVEELPKTLPYAIARMSH